MDPLMPTPTPTPTPPPVESKQPQVHAPLTAEEQNYFGNQLFQRIHATHAEQAGKLTGMLLELDKGPCFLGAMHSIFTLPHQCGSAATWPHLLCHTGTCYQMEGTYTVAQYLAQAPC